LTQRASSAYCENRNEGRFAVNAYAQQIVVQALDPAQMDQLFAGLWNGMNATTA